MDTFSDAFVWLNDPANWRGEGGVLGLTADHLYVSAMAMLLACLVAWPLALWMGHTGRGGGAAVVVSNVSRAIPTLALLTIFVALFEEFGNNPTILALAIFAVPPLLANTYTGMREVDPEVVDAARGMGLSGGQVLWRVEVPLAVPLIATGFRTAAVQVVATAPLAALVGGSNLGSIITLGFGLQQYDQVIAGGILVAVLALLVEGVLALVERAVSPPSAKRVPRRSRRRAAALAAT
ncbi:MAG TPA: ABC transporter permease [Cryptosporangiaceae bacterium]|nr:ABC transporter permease [Cryptosporangiaceae bacterium]